MSAALIPPDTDADRRARWIAHNRRLADDLGLDREMLAQWAAWAFDREDAA